MKSRLLYTLPVLYLTFGFYGLCQDKVTVRKNLIRDLDLEVKKELTENLLPWWSAKMTDKKRGGFYGRIDADDRVWTEDDKGGILNARILWTYSSAYRILKDTAYLSKAKRARDYILKYFIDPVYGGAYRSVKANGEISDSRKQIYTNSFFIYALSEYFRSTGDAVALKSAQDIYSCVEKYAADNEGGGYFEVFARDWKRSHDRLIGEKTDSDEKTMNTHLHLLESYTSLYRVWPDRSLRERLVNIVSLFEKKIIDPKTYHLISFLDKNWIPTSESFSFGHDIECSWLLCETAAVLDDPGMMKRITAISLKIADAAAEGIQSDGSMATEKDLKTGEITSTRSWWEQAETIVGFLNAFKLTDNEKYLDYAINCWKYISSRFIDRMNGGWFSKVNPDGTPGRNDKAGFWICPYHNGRMCLEVIERTEHRI